MAWFDEYQPDLGAASVAEQLRRFRKGTEVAMEDWGKALPGGQNFPVQPAAPMEVYGAAPTPSDALRPAPPTISPTIDSSNINESAFQDYWKQYASQFGLSANPNHDDMNKNVRDMWARGGRLTMTPAGQPDAWRFPDGKDVPVTPNAFAMTQTSEQLDQARQVAGVQVPAAPAQAPSGIASVDSRTWPQPPPFTQMQGQVQAGAPVAPPPAAPPLSPSPPMPVPSEAAAGLSRTGTQLLRAPAGPTGFWDNPEKVGKFQQAMGILATAMDAKRYGPAGEMLQKTGGEEITRGRADAAARLAGYPSAEAMVAAKGEVETRKGLSEIDLNARRGAYYDVEGRLAEARLPGLKADEQLTMANARRTQVATDHAIKMGPVPITIGGNRYMVSPQEGLHAQLQMTNSMISYENMLSNVKHNAQATEKLKQDVAKTVMNIPVSIQGANGPQQVMMNVDEYIRHRAVTLGATNKEEQQRLKAYEEFIKPVVKHYAEALPGMTPTPLPANLINSMEMQAREMLRSGDPFWEGQGRAALLLIGKPAPSQPKASDALRGGVAPVPAGSSAWDQPAPRSR